MKLKGIFSPSVPKSPTGKFLLFFVGEILSSCLIVADMRAVAIVSFVWTGIINMIFFLINWWFLRVITKAEKEGESENFWMALGYVIGGVIGAELGLYLTIKVYGR
jgi:hypothetical protein